MPIWFSFVVWKCCFIFIFIFFAWVFCLHVCICSICFLDTHWGEKKASDPLRLVLWTAVNLPESAGHWLQVLWNSNKCSQPPSQLSSPRVEFEGLRWVYLCLVHIHSLAPRPCHWEGNLRGRQTELIEPHSAEGQRKLRGFSKLADGDFRWSSWEPTLSTRSSVSTMLQGQTSYKLSFLERAGRVLIEMIYNFLFMLSDQDWPFDSKCYNTLSFQLLSWQNRFKAPPLSKAPRAFGLDHFETSFSISFIHVVPKEAECGLHSHARTRKIFGTWSNSVTCGFLQCP